jgi:hypothetical protein
MKKSHLTAYGKKLWKLHQGGGGWWSSFTDAVKSASRTVYDKAIKPAYQYVKDKPITTAAALSSMIPVAGKFISPILGVAGKITGKGKKRTTKRKQAGGSARKQAGGSSKMIAFKGL